MSQFPDLNRLIHSAIDASTNPSRWNGLCDEIVAHTGANTFIVFEYDVARHEAAHCHSSKKFRLQGKHYIEGLLKGEAPEEFPVYEAVAANEPAVFSTEAELLGAAYEDDFERNMFRKGVLDVTGAKSRNGGRLNDIGPFVDVAALHLPYECHELPNSLRQQMNILFPILGKVIETGRVIRGLTEQYQALLQVFDQLEFGAVIVKDDGEVLISNSSFNEILLEKDGITLDQGRVSTLNSKDDAKLRRALHAARLPQKNMDVLVTNAKRRSRRLPYILKAAPLNDPERDIGKHGLVLLLVLDPDSSERVSASGIGAFDLLSPAELEVADYLVKGLSQADIAKRRDTSPETIRSQSKSIASKLDCRSRIDLVRLAMATATPLSTKKD